MSRKRLGDFILPRLNLPSETSIISVVDKGKHIPKIIHQCFHTKLLPVMIQENIDRMMTLNPEYEYRLYDDVDMTTFLENNFEPCILDYYNRINPKYGAARADLFRYLLIYKCGGVYLDIKSSLTKPLRDVLKADDQYVLSHWPKERGGRFDGWGLHDELKALARGEFQQWQIAAAPGHPFLKAVIENVLRNIHNYNPVVHGVGDIGVWRTTGPIAYTLAIAPLLNLHSNRIIADHIALGLEYSVFDSTTIGSHKALFQSHYSTLTESIVKTNVIASTALMLQILARRIKAKCDKACRSISNPSSRA